jgi:hypothetical protein
MDNGPRKATDVLLEMEAKINALLALVRTQDLNIKVLSNKLNTLMETINNAPTTQAPQKIIVEAIQNGGTSNFAPERDVFVNPDTKLEIDDFSKGPKGFRRTSRPESYAGDNSYLKRDKTPPPPNNTAEVIVPDSATRVQQPAANFQPRSNEIVQNAIPIQQRVVDKNGKSVFLAEVEVIDLSNGTTFTKTKTNGTGKWATALPAGNYKVFIRKRESSTKDKIEIAQDIVVDGKQNPLDLPMMIIK